MMQLVSGLSGALLLVVCARNESSALHSLTYLLQGHKRGHVQTLRWGPGPLRGAPLCVVHSRCPLEYLTHVEKAQLGSAAVRTGFFAYSTEEKRENMRCQQPPPPIKLSSHAHGVAFSDGIIWQVEVCTSTRPELSIFHERHSAFAKGQQEGKRAASETLTEYWKTRPGPPSEAGPVFGAP